MRRRWIAAVAAAVMVLAPAAVASAQEDDDDPPYESPYGDHNRNFIVCYNYATGHRVDDTIVYDEWGMYAGVTCPDGYTAIPYWMQP